jgi:hypothetical protein
LRKCDRKGLSVIGVQFYVGEEVRAREFEARCKRTRAERSVEIEEV